MDEIMVSVCCLVYNHEKYLRQCLDGFMMQKTKFKFEVLIHDDASTDGSADIIREYEAKYPDVIKPIYQTENQYSKGVKISWEYQFPRAKGKYIALCEGDDYWTDEYKLQKQFDALEAHPDCSICTHIVHYVTENGVATEYKRPLDIDINPMITSDELIETCLSSYLFHTSCYFFRAVVFKQYHKSVPRFIKVASVGDTPLMLFLGTKGNCYYIKEVMSSRRIMSTGSWSQKMMNDSDYQLHYVQNHIEMLKAFDEFSNKKYSDQIEVALLQYEIMGHVHNNDYRACLAPRYRQLFMEFSLKKRVAYRVFACFPKLRTIYLKMRKK